MNNSIAVQNLRNKSEAFKKTIKSCIEEIEKTNNEIVAQIQINEASMVQHNKDIEQLKDDNAELDALREENIQFIQRVEDILPDDEVVE